MKKRKFKDFLIVLVVFGIFMVSKHVEAAKDNTYWVVGVTKEMEEGNKFMKVSYDGYNLYLSGYIGKAGTKTKALNKERSKTKKKQFKISKSCKILLDSGSESIKEFLKQNRKGKITGYVELQVKKGKVIKIQYGA